MYTNIVATTIMTPIPITTAVTRTAATIVPVPSLLFDPTQDSICT